MNEINASGRIRKRKTKPDYEVSLERTWWIGAGYAFFPIPAEDLVGVEASLREMARERQLTGLVIMATEGLNMTLAGNKQDLEIMENQIRGWAKQSDWEFKWSQANTAPFRRFQVKTRDEIVTIGLPETHPPGPKNHHLSPEEWDRVLKEESEEIVLIDTRNAYETEIGKFKGALTPEIEEFTEFPKYFEELKIPKDKKVLIYCTGGIRCEKGILAVQEKGYENVFQLQGGILKYLEEFPNSEFEGECFVFDNRVAVDQNLAPTQVYTLCPKCGQPAKEEINCVRCDKIFKICHHCMKEAELKPMTCSKNCDHHWELSPGKKGKTQKRKIFFRV